MSIFSSPFPKDGHDRVPSVFVAERVLLAAVVIDGRDILGSDFDGIVQWEQIGSEQPIVELPRIPSGIGVNRVRKPIGELWGRMTLKAKAMFLVREYAAAVEYLDECMDNMRETFGEDAINDGKLLDLPTGQELLGRWLQG